MNSRGSSGPIQTCFPPTLHSIDEPFQLSMRNMGLKPNPDPYDGDVSTRNMVFGDVNIMPSIEHWYLGHKYQPRSQDVLSLICCNRLLPTKQASSQPHRAPVNKHDCHCMLIHLQVLTEATVARVLFADRHSAHESLTATGVEFHLGSDTSHGHVARAKSEVILSAGAIKSPQLLELSGVGKRDVLDRLGVDVKIDLPGVGENVQEHIMFGAYSSVPWIVSHIDA